MRPHTSLLHSLDFSKHSSLLSSYLNPKSLWIQILPFIWFDDISGLLDLVRNEGISYPKYRKWNGRLRKEIIIHRLVTQSHIYFETRLRTISSSIVGGWLMRNGSSVNVPWGFTPLNLSLCILRSSSRRKKSIIFKSLMKINYEFNW
ncbi:hypothetical protein LINPERPRIM_LOCUS38931 [Linum perenne]